MPACRFMSCGEESVEDGRGDNVNNRVDMVLRAVRRLEAAGAPAEIGAILQACIMMHVSTHAGGEIVLWVVHVFAKR